MRPSTASVHAGAPRPQVGAAVVLPLVRSVIHHLDEEVYQARLGGGSEVLVYAREMNPTVRAVEERLAHIEGADRSLLFSSGQAALQTLLLGSVRRGDRVITSRAIYGGSTELLRRMIPVLGATLVEVELNVEGELERALGTKDDVALVFCESICNPLTQVTDLPLVVGLTQRFSPRAIVAVDATLASPLGQRPLELDVDVVMHSATKYLSGHSDVLGGVLSGSEERMAGLLDWRTQGGACMDPQAAWLLERGMKTLGLRIERQSANALACARALEGRGAVASVHYCGLDSSPYQGLAKALLQYNGGLFSIVLEGGDGAALRFVDALRLFANAASLGGVESLASRPRSMSHGHLSEGEREELGLLPGLVRLACGIEDAGDLIEDLVQALDSLD
ncbi:MAG: cystathionine beta-lyase/cystathionine gamma-synthase [Planctomycetota bacterium]|jgi:cystathionine beta-lyase/cystathionine gamma-synthase